MEDEETPEDTTKKNRIKLVVIMVVLTLLGAVIYSIPIFVYPDNIVHDDSLSEFNSHTTNAQLTLEEGRYEVWLSTSILSWFNLDMPLVHVNDTTGQPLNVDYTTSGDDRNIEGTECRHFATFRIREEGTYNVTIIAPLMSMGIPGTEEVFVVEERPTAYSALQSTGILLMVVGMIGVVLLLILMSITSTEEKRAQIRKAQPPGTYPPPAYAPYQQQPPPGYPQYPSQPPPPQGYPQYPNQPQPPPGQAPRRPPPY
jgi:flagellar basal body-associated protein FliL